jgi:urease accessory protein
MKLRIVYAAAAALIPGLAFAHPGDVHTHGFFAGLEHPWTGLDHMAAMLAAGLWTSRLGGRAIVAMLCATAIGIAAGAALGMMQGSLSLAEQVTAGSAVVLGLLAATARAPRVPIAAVLVGFFCLFHGYVHAVETPQQYWQPAFTAGFIASMLALQLLGAGLATLFSSRTVLTRAAGASCAAAGVVALFLLT